MTDEAGAVVVGARDIHKLVLVQQHTDALTGEEWDILECPQCGLLQKVQWEPFKKVNLRTGEGMLSAGDAAEILELAEQGPAGLMEATQKLAREPRHSYVRVPTEAELREAFVDLGLGALFDEAAREAMIEGKPLLRINVGGTTATTWVQGTGPEQLGEKSRPR